MPQLVFVVDTSASMNQRIANGLTLIDCVKSGIEHFHKVRQRDPSSRHDRYMLVTCDEATNYIQVVDSQAPHLTFLSVLKGVQARHATAVGPALRAAFAFLHRQRLASDVDRFGQGRNPAAIEPTIIMLLTDGTEFTDPKTGTATTALSLPSLGGTKDAIEGSELYTGSAPQRWDQRLFSTILRIPSVSSEFLEASGPFPASAPISGSPAAVAVDVSISSVCEATGGKCHVMTSWKGLLQHMEGMASRLLTPTAAAAAVISFEQIPVPGKPALPHHVHLACQRKLLFVRPPPATNPGGGGGGGTMTPSGSLLASQQQQQQLQQQQQQGNWLVPEPFWPDFTTTPQQQQQQQTAALPPREPHPTLLYRPVDTEPRVPANFPVDRYEVEACPLLGRLLKAAPGACWQLYMRGSKGAHHHGNGDPFGFVRVNRASNTLVLFLLPYNYPVLFSLLEKLGPHNRSSPPAAWRQELSIYCAGVPPYYSVPLRVALRRWGVLTNVVPDAMDKGMGASAALQQLRQLRQLGVSTLEKQLMGIAAVSAAAAAASGASTPTSLSNAVVSLVGVSNTMNPDQGGSLALGGAAAGTNSLLKPPPSSLGRPFPVLPLSAELQALVESSSSYSTKGTSNSTHAGSLPMSTNRFFDPPPFPPPSSGAVSRSAEASAGDRAFSHSAGLAASHTNNAYDTWYPGANERDFGQQQQQEEQQRQKLGRSLPFDWKPGEGEGGNRSGGSEASRMNFLSGGGRSGFVAAGTGGSSKSGATGQEARQLSVFENIFEIPRSSALMHALEFPARLAAVFSSSAADSPTCTPASTTTAASGSSNLVGTNAISKKSSSRASAGLQQQQQQLQPQQVKSLPAALARVVGDNDEDMAGWAKELVRAAQRWKRRRVEANKHSVSIDKMGDFAEALMKQQQPRNPLVDEQERARAARSMFGNPYRQDKGGDEGGGGGSGGGGANEAYFRLDDSKSPSSPSGGGRGRRRQRSTSRSPSPSPPPSPILTPSPPPSQQAPHLSLSAPPGAAGPAGDAAREARGGAEVREGRDGLARGGGAGLDERERRRAAAEEEMKVGRGPRGVKREAGGQQASFTAPAAAAAAGAATVPAAPAAVSLRTSKGIVQGPQQSFGGEAGATAPAPAAATHQAGPPTPPSQPHPLSPRQPALPPSSCPHMSAIIPHSTRSTAAAAEPVRQTDPELPSRAGVRETAAAAAAASATSTAWEDQYLRRTVVSTQGIVKDQSEVVDSVLRIFRELRSTRPNQTKEFFALLTTPDFPVDRPRLVQSLVHKAERFNKPYLVRELNAYLQSLAQGSSQQPAIGQGGRENGEAAEVVATVGSALPNGMPRAQIAS